MRKTALRIASCQFPVSADIVRNARYIRGYLRRAAEGGAHLLHTSEACLSGYVISDFPDFKTYHWDRLRQETARLRDLAREMRIWLVLGSTHWIQRGIPPTNCLYLIDPKGEVVDRYDKCMLTEGDRKGYSAGDRLVTRTIHGVKLGFAICYDACYPQIYAAYRQAKVEVMLHSFYNAGHAGPTCLCELTEAQIPTRCADNALWAIANNSTRRYSAWGSFVARPDATIAQQLPQNRAGMLMHDFPDVLPQGGWLHNTLPLNLSKETPMWYGTPSRHPRQADGSSEP